MTRKKSELVSSRAIHEATGKTWRQWQTVLRAMNAAALSHKEIAARLHSKHGVSGWWSQTLTVQFERAIGRRQVGQTSTGDFAAAATKTLIGSKDKALRDWQALVGRRRAFDRVDFARAPSVSGTKKWRYWRVALADGSKVTIVISAKRAGKALLGVNHERLPNVRAVRRWKIFWRGFLEGLTEAD